MSESVRVESKIVNAKMELHMTEDSYVPDVLTRIRILPTVAVVGQTSKVRRTDYGFTVLDVYVKFLPIDKNLLSSLKRLMKLIKDIPTVNSVKLDSVDDRPVTVNGTVLQV